LIVVGGNRAGRAIVRLARPDSSLRRGG